MPILTGAFGKPGLERAVAKTVLIAQSALPCALFMVGAVLGQQRLAGFLAAAWTPMALKLLLKPVLVWLLVRYVVPVDQLWAATAILMAGVPTAVNFSAFAKGYVACLAPAPTRPCCLRYWSSSAPRV